MTCPEAFSLPPSERRSAFTAYGLAFLLWARFQSKLFSAGLDAAPPTTHTHTHRPPLRLGSKAQSWGCRRPSSQAAEIVWPIQLKRKAWIKAKLGPASVRTPMPTGLFNAALKEDARNSGAHGPRHANCMLSYGWNADQTEPFCKPEAP